MPRLESSVDRRLRRMRSDWPDHLGPLSPRSIPEFLSTPNATNIGFRFVSCINTLEQHEFGPQGAYMAADAKLALLPKETAETPAARRDAPQKQPERPAAIAAAPTPEKASRSPRRRWVRWALFALLPLVLIAGAYWYVTGGQVMSTDDAYVNAETGGISTDISGIVQ